jgi:uncharacterized protein YbjQ (UPF0145 family)
MAEWDGDGLPPAAAARMARFDAHGVRTSVLDVAGAMSTVAVGLPPVGEVMGCMVQRIGWTGYAGCGYYGGYGGWSWSPPTVTSSKGRGVAGYRPYVDALYRGYDTAIERMLTEARGMGADGVIGVRLSADHLGEDGREFVALGTAVRSPGRVHPPQPFVTDLAGADVAKLLRAGWVPVAVVIGISVAVRHIDSRTAAQMTSQAGNTEVAGYTQLVQRVRADARGQFAERAARSGADGALVSTVDLRTWDQEGGGCRDHVAESLVIGTAIARFGPARASAGRPLSVLPLRRA